MGSGSSPGGRRGSSQGSQGRIPKGFTIVARVGGGGTDDEAE